MKETTSQIFFEDDLLERIFGGEGANPSREESEEE